MRMRKFVQTLVLAVLSLLICCDNILADAIDISNRLSKELKVELKNVTIAEALSKIGQKAEVPIILSNEASWKLPQGESTRLSVKLDGPLSESLAGMLNSFFMRYAIDSNQVTVFPKDELDHILGRPTTAQLELLKKIYSNPIRVYYQDELQKSINEAIGTELMISPIYTHGQLNNILQVLAGKQPKPRQIDVNMPAGQKYNLPTPVTLVQMINQLEAQSGNNHYSSEYTRWYISGMDFPGQIPEIKVMVSSDFLNAKRNQKIDVSYNNEPLDKIFQELASRGGLKLTISSGLHLNEYRISVSIQNLNIREAIQKVADIAGVTLNQDDRTDDLYVQNFVSKPKENIVNKAQSPDCSGNYVGKISVPMNNGEYFIEFMLRECDLTEELKNLRKEKLGEILKQFTKTEQSK